MSLGHGSSIVRDGLVLHFDAANVKSYPGSGTTWTDLSGNDNHGTLINGTTYDSGNSGSLSFDGTNDRVSVTINDFVTSWDDPFSLEATIYIPSSADWHYTVDGGNSGTAIIGRGGYAGSLGLLRRDTQKFAAWIRTDGGIYTPEYVAAPDTWYCLSQVYTGTVVSLYVNGSLIGSSTVASKAGAPDAGTFHIGGPIAFGGRSGEYGEGKIPSVRAYNKALSAAEIRQNFEALRGRYGI